MFEIKGKYATAKCFATAIDNNAISQIIEVCNMPFAENQSIRIMPDAHAGAGCTIGTTMTMTDAVCANLVGVDIGCGMLTVDIGTTVPNLPDFDDACHKVPSGFDVWDTPQKEFETLEELRCFDKLTNLSRIKCSLGSLGGGNHFWELEQSSNGHVYFIIHSGSRNLGKQIAEHYQKRAIDLHNGRDPKEKAALIAQLKSEGREQEIQAELQKLNSKKTHIPDALCWLYGEAMDDYIHDLKIAQEFARQNRELMAKTICDIMRIEPVDAFHTIHNYIDTDEMILRKGAIAAHENELVLIPLNMRDGSVLARGRGNSDWNMSAPHGAGRLMSRSKAKNSISLDDFKASMEGIYTTSVNESTLDESPMAYKSKDDIIEPIADAVDIVEVMTPLYNFKA